MKKLSFLLGMVFAASALMQADVLGIGGSSGVTVADINLTTGNATILGRQPFGAPSTFSLTYDPTANVYYTVSNQGSGLGLYQVNPSNGAFTIIAPVSAPAGVIYSLAVSPSSGRLYAADYTTLYAVNKQTGALSTIGSMSVGDVRTLTFSPDGTLYGYTLQTGEAGPRGRGFFKVDPANAQTTVLTPIGSTPDPLIQSLAFTPTGTLWGAEQGAMVQLNPATGQPDDSTRVTLSTFPPPLNGVAYLASPATVPEPTGCILVGIGFSCLIGLRRKLLLRT